MKKARLLPFCQTVNDKANDIGSHVTAHQIKSVNICICQCM